jgi:hypothetical protein
MSQTITQRINLQWIKLEQGKATKVDWLEMEQTIRQILADAFLAPAAKLATIAEAIGAYTGRGTPEAYIRPCTDPEPPAAAPVSPADADAAAEWSIDAAMAERDQDDEQEPPACPACSGPGVSLGSLGYRAHFTCRNCGMQFSHDTRHA